VAALGKGSSGKRRNLRWTKRTRGSCLRKEFIWEGGITADERFAWDKTNRREKGRYDAFWREREKGRLGRLREGERALYSARWVGIIVIERKDPAAGGKSIAARTKDCNYPRGK